ncbi:MAG: T9SS type A sorting domain-containing protein [Calditrichaeota bacterium]|nr:T9SS type A sorting domain-containing protein [Calditrichota bacterium]
MRALFLFLVLPACLFAQQVQFFEVPVAGSAAQVVAAGAGDAIDVFYQLDGDIYHLTFDRASETVSVPAHLLSFPGSEPKDVMTAEILPNGDWVCVISGCENCQSWPKIHSAWVVQGHGGTIVGNELIYEAEDQGLPYDCCGALEGPRIAVNPDGGYVITGVVPGRWGVENSAQLLLYPYLNGVYEVGDHFMNVFPQFVVADSLDILSSASLGGTHHQRVPIECFLDCDPAMTFHYSGWVPSLMLFSPEQELLVLFDDVLLRLHDEEARDTVAVLEQALGWFPPRGDVNSDYGFAFLRSFQNSLELFRVDTQGEVPAESGTVGWNAIPNSANVNFADDGELLVAYGQSATSLGLAVVPWSAPLDAQEPPTPIAQDFSLAAYPNPFNSFVRIEYDLPRAGDVRLSVFNTLGQEVAMLVDERVAAGAHSLTWSPGGASGVYLVRLVSSDFVSSKKVLYIR